MIQLIGWLNPWPLQAWLFRNRALLKDGPINALDDEIGGKVPNLKALLDQATKLAAPLGLDVAAAGIQQLPAGDTGSWRATADYPLAVHVCLVANPACRLYSDGAQWVPTPGQVLVKAADKMHSAGNFGKTPWIDLVMVLEKAKEKEE